MDKKTLTPELDRILEEECKKRYNNRCTIKDLLFQEYDSKSNCNWINNNFRFIDHFRHPRPSLSLTTDQLKDYCKEKKIFKIKEHVYGGYTLQSVDSVSNKLLLLENIYEYLFGTSYPMWMKSYEFGEEEWEEIKRIYYRYYC